jgi:hypothetical protein
LQRVTRSASDTRYRYYRCRGKQAQVSSGRLQPCPARFSPATRLDELVWADLCAVLQQPQQVAQALERAHSGAWVPQELRRRQATLRSVRASVARQRQRLLEAYLAEVIDLACFQRQDRTLAGQETDLLAREREVTAQGERLVEVRATARSMTQVLEGPRAGLGQASFEQRRQLVELLVDRVVVTDGQVEIRYVIPTTPGSAKTRFCHLRTDYFQVEPAEKAAPPAVDIGGGGAGGRGPQPHRLGVAVAGQVVDLQADQRALDDGELALVVEPAGAVGEPGVQPVPAAGRRGAVAGGLGRGLRLGPGGRVAQGKLAAVPGRPSCAGVWRRGGAGSRRTRSQRRRPSSSTGRSASTNASRVTS